MEALPPVAKSLIGMLQREWGAEDLWRRINTPSTALAMSEDLCRLISEDEESFNAPFAACTLEQIREERHNYEASAKPQASGDTLEAKVAGELTYEQCKHIANGGKFIIVEKQPAKPPVEPLDTPPLAEYIETNLDFVDELKERLMDYARFFATVEKALDLDQASLLRLLLRPSSLECAIETECINFDGMNNTTLSAFLLSAYTFKKPMSQSDAQGRLEAAGVDFAKFCASIDTDEL